LTVTAHVLSQGYRPHKPSERNDNVNAAAPTVVDEPDYSITIWADTEPYADILSPPEAAPTAESKPPKPSREATEAEETEWGLA
jgi:hypothetical protein